MDQAIIKYWKIDTEKIFSRKLITEYPFTSKLKMMGHVWEDNNKALITVKGSPESVLKICKITDHQRDIIKKQQDYFAQIIMMTSQISRQQLKNVN